MTTIRFDTDYHEFIYRRSEQAYTLASDVFRWNIRILCLECLHVPCIFIDVPVPNMIAIHVCIHRMRLLNGNAHSRCRSTQPTRNVHVVNLVFDGAMVCGQFSLVLFVDETNSEQFTHNVITLNVRLLAFFVVGYLQVVFPECR